jgi:hypothetical protein
METVTVSGANQILRGGCDREPSEVRSPAFQAAERELRRKSLVFAPTSNSPPPPTPILAMRTLRGVHKCIRAHRAKGLDFECRPRHPSEPESAETVPVFVHSTNEKEAH